MTDYQLYINGQACDLALDTSVTLVYNSGLFSSLDAIQSNRSYNIDLPMTSRNMGVFRFAAIPNADSDMPYIKVKASLYKGGIPIFENGFAVITEISDVISITLTWGNVDNFDPLFDSPMSALSDTLYEMGIGSIPWNAYSKVMTITSDEMIDGMGFYAIDYGMGLSKPQYVHPAIRVDRVLEAIEKYQGIKIKGAPLRGDWEYAHVVPCLSLNGDAVSSEHEMVTARCGIITMGRLVFSTASVDTQLRDPRHVVTGTFKNLIDVSRVDKVRIVIDGPLFGFGFDVAIEHATSLPSGLYLKCFKDNTISNEFLSTQKDGNKYHFNRIDITLDVSKNDTISFRVHDAQTSDFSAPTIVHPNWHIDVISYYDDVIYPSVYPIGVNLPDMSQGEFLQSLMVLNGLFAYVDNQNPNTINLMSPTDIINRIDEGNYVDWSEKIVLNEKRITSIPDASEFIVENYAQKNILDYDNDDDVTTKTAGEILIDNVNLEKETELTDMEFSASENVDYGDSKIAQIPIYKKQENSNDADYSELSPRILSISYVEADDELYPCGYFPEMLQFGGNKGIVANSYAGLQQIIERFRIITVRVKLSMVDLYKLDYRIPIYLSQFGRFYAIYSIETGENDICECKLVQLPLPNSRYIGANLLTNTKNFTTGWLGGGILYPNTYNGFNVYYQDGSTTTGYWDIRYQIIIIMPGTEYTLSFYAKGSGELRTFVFPNTDATILATNGDPEFVGQVRADGRCGYTLTSEWKRYFITFRTTDDTTKIDPAGTNKTVLFRVVAGHNEAYICGAKLEQGNVPTDWSPAPGDN